MNRKCCQVAIVGSGLAGLAAARILGEYALDVWILDENIHLGGQFLRGIPSKPWTVAGSDPSRMKRIGSDIMRSLNGKKVRTVNRATVLGFDGHRELLVDEDGKMVTIVPEILIFATGARERFLPFKGWTLPGVISTGALQVLMKGSGVLASKQCLIGGTGFFPYAAAYDYLGCHGKIIALLDQGTLWKKLWLLSCMLDSFSKLKEGAAYLMKLFASDVPVRFRTKIIEANGDGTLEKVIAATINRKGDPIAGTERVFGTGTLAVGFGFCANIELPQQGGCALKYDADLGGWVVEVTEDLETSIENVYAAGELTGIGGAYKSYIEGRLCAYAVLKKLKGEKTDPLIARLRKKRKHEMRFAMIFNRLSRVPIRWSHSVDDETIVCRCEDITMGEIRKALAEGHRTPAAIKRAVRAGMGNCQGRICGPLLYDIIAGHDKTDPAAIPPFSSRIPVKPVSLDTLAG